MVMDLFLHFLVSRKKLFELGLVFGDYRFLHFLLPVQKAFFILLVKPLSYCLL